MYDLITCNVTSEYIRKTCLRNEKKDTHCLNLKTKYNNY